jgi:glycine/D-amino acid oxidase-like deaminating enzyme
VPARTLTADLPVVVIGAGPVGLAAAAHLLERGLEPLILEAGDQPGASIAQWRHVRLFTPWCLALDPAALRLLASTGWNLLDPDWLPTGHDLLERYLLPLAATPRLAPRLRLGHTVTGIARLGLDKVRGPGREDLPFVVRVRGRDGDEHDLEASAVVDASGTWTQPNPLALAALRRQVPATQIVWAVRSATPRPLVGKGDARADELPARGQLAADLRGLIHAGEVELVSGFRIRALRSHPDGHGVAVTGHGPAGLQDLHADQVINATGFRPDHTIARELRLALDPALESSAALAPLIDPNVHTCGTVALHGAHQLAHPDQGYYVVGMKSYGRAPTFLLATGYEQVRSVAAAVAGDQQATTTTPSGPPTARFCRVTTELLRDANGAQRLPLHTTIAPIAKLPSHRAEGSPEDWGTSTCCDQATLDPASHVG